MGEESKIAWTHATFNPWWGCTRVSPGCEHCYAEQLATVRRKLPVWGVDAERKPMSEAYWREPIKWNKKARARGERMRVFCASMADVFELPPARNTKAHDVMSAARPRLWSLIEETPWLDWLLLTKRPQNVPLVAPWPLDVEHAWPANVWLGTTCEDQQRANERLPVLLRLRHELADGDVYGPRTLFVSYEPAIGPVNWTRIVEWERAGSLGRPAAHIEFDALLGWVDLGGGEHPGLDWLIVGGESGYGAREFKLRWAYDSLNQCREVGTRFFMKQLGRVFERLDGSLVLSGDTKGGNESEWPADLRVQEFPHGRP